MYIWKWDNNKIFSTSYKIRKFISPIYGDKTLLSMLQGEILLYVDHPKMKILPHLCLELPVQEAYLPRPECAAMEIDWQLLSPVTLLQHVNPLADLEGACPAHAPLRVQILSFRHTKFLKSSHLGSPRPPPMRSTPPPTGNPGSATAIYPRMQWWPPSFSIFNRVRVYPPLLNGKISRLGYHVNLIFSSYRLMI